MKPTSLVQLLSGPFNFLRSDPEEIRRLFPEHQRALPLPRAIFMEDESVTPVHGFALLASDGMAALRTALHHYVLAEEAMQIASQRREPPDLKAYGAAWDRYRALVTRAVENATLSSYGRQYPAIFWLHHSLDVARLLKETPKRILRADTEIGRRLGDALKYRILDRFLDRVFSTTYDLVHKIAGDIEAAEEELFPRLLTRMRDNVLVFSEDHIGPDLGELSSYFNGSLRIDGRDLRQRREELGRWHADRLAKDDELRHLAVHVLGCDDPPAPADLLLRPGYVTFLSTLKGYDTSRLLPPPLVAVWENLLLKLKEFELLHALRKRLITVEPRENGTFLARELPGLGPAGRREHHLSNATRPMDFLAPWVVDPRVERFGMVYDISDFSQTLTLLHRAGHDSQEDAFRTMFRLQRRINQVALHHRAKMEKYLGDGAFFSSREALNLLICSIHVQRNYVQALAEGLPFDRGLRIALNYGSYRLIPLSGGPEDGERYEFFGPGLVELTRLTSGKATKEVDEVKAILINQGFAEQDVHRFFAPLTEKDVDVVNKREEARRFHAYLNRNGTLHNNGIVATQPFMARLETEIGPRPLRRAVEEDRSYTVLELPGADGLLVGIRKLGMAHLKGLESLAVYEVIDAGSLDGQSLKPAAGSFLMSTLDREFAGGLKR